MHSCIFCVIIFIGVVHYCMTSDCSTSTNKRPKIKDAILREDLLCKYNKDAGTPLRNQSEILNVTISMNVDSYSIIPYFPVKLTVDHVLIVKWHDEFLMWNPADYELIKEIKMNTDDIWKPHLVPEEEEFLTGTESLMESIECKVASSGNITCSITTSHSGYCDNDNSRWPYDIHSCNIQYMSLGIAGGFVHIKASKTDPVVFNKNKNKEWKILNTTQEGFISSPSSRLFMNEIYFLFELERYTENIMREMYISIFALVSITLMIFWAHPATVDRTILIAVNFMSHLFYVQYMEWTVPKATSLPYTLGFYTNSLLLSAIAMVESIILKQMIHSTKNTPGWIFALDRFTSRNAIKRILLIDAIEVTELKDEESACTDNEIPLRLLDQHNQITKIYIAQLVDRMFFLIYVIVYLVEIFTVTTFKLLPDTFEFK